jgi:N-methylhydantoinase A/oxoprolinase/acetone carboxylase beta subunit
MAAKPKAHPLSKPTFIIGIDTGGTYTDAVVIARDSQKVLASAKALTTKGDLSIGVGEAMGHALAALADSVGPQAISLVSISTTLATNAVVEGHGSAAAAILIGFDPQMVERTGIAAAFPDMPIVMVGGGHDHNGEAQTQLDLAALNDAVAALKGRVKTFAIASSFAVRNNAHEIAARECISRLTQAPATLSSELSSSLDAPRRALTAVLNARLISHITHLIVAVKTAMARLQLSCPLMIMKGDGSLALADSVVLRPIETILSGPAASLVGAKWLSGLDDFILSDMGGTTTDVGLVLKGRPQIAAQGAEVGGWRTMVKAIDVKTIGLGGDSEVAVVANGRLEIGPQRSVPLSLLAHRYPRVLTLLEADLAETDGASMHGKFVCLPFGRMAASASEGLKPREAEILAEVGEVPVPFRKLAVSSTAQRALQALRRKGLVQLCGFTPSDAAHVLNLQSNWNRDAAVMGAKLLHRFRTMKMADDAAFEAFAREVWDETVTKSTHVMLHTALGDLKGAETLVEVISRGRTVMGQARIAITPQVPLVAVGGPVRIYYSEVARRLGCEVVFAPFCDVANAVGAAAALVAVRVVISVEGDGNGAFRVHGDGQSQIFGSGKLALDAARKRAHDIASLKAHEGGAQFPRIQLSEQLSLLPEARDEDGLLTAIITAEATGRP